LRRLIPSSPGCPKCGSGHGSKNRRRIEDPRIPPHAPLHVHSVAPAMGRRLSAIRRRPQRWAGALSLGRKRPRRATQSIAHFNRWRNNAYRGSGDTLVCRVISLASLGIFFRKNLRAFLIDERRVFPRSPSRRQRVTPDGQPGQAPTRLHNVPHVTPNALI
jgi:hypothetical protein